MTPLLLMRRVVHNLFSRFRRAAPARLLGGWARARRLKGGDPAARAPAADGLRVVVSLTTVPDRIDRIQPALRSLLDQTRPPDRILLAWPAQSLRSGKPYPPPPVLPAGVELLTCEDLGPATKLLPALLAEPAALLVATDDDVIYPDDFIETLLRAHRRRPEAAVGLRGWRLEPDVDPRQFAHIFTTAVATETPVDALLGTWGYLVPPGALDGAVHDFEGWPPEARWVDDIWISGHLARRGVARLVAPGRSLPVETAASAVAALTDGLNRSGRNDLVAIEAFRAWWRAPPRSTSPVERDH